MVLRWTKGATTKLRRRIDLGQINPNFEDAPNLGDIVSGEHFPEYEALPPKGRQTAIVRFRRLFRRIRLGLELQGQRRLAEGGEEEGKFLVMCFALMCMCAKPDSLLVTVHAEEGIDLDDYFGEDEENLDDDDDEQDDEDEGDEDNEVSQVPPPAGRGRGRGRAAPAVRRSPPRPAAAAASVPVANVEMLTGNLARANLSSPTFNFQASSPMSSSQPRP
jgi:hypothetical protein